MHRTCALLAALMLALGVAACGSGDDGGSSGGSGSGTGPGAGKPAVTLGTKNFTEQFILGQLYAQALRAKGWKVDLKENIGSTEVTDRALTSGSIDLYPEYTGTTLSVVKADTMSPMSAHRTYEAAKAFYAKRGQTMLRPAAFEDRDTLAVTKRFARRHDLASTEDLKRVGGRPKIGAAPEFRTRYAGLEGLREAYGLRNLRFVPLEIGEAYRALDDGRVDVADVFTTDGQLADGDYVVLDDPKAIFGFQNLAPVVDTKVLQRQGPEFERTLNAVTDKLTNDVMRRMNAEVALKERDPADVAREFLTANALI
jgi:osmoprotectant transport system substrate-binding protein